MGSQDEGSYSRILLEQRPAFAQCSLGSVAQEPHESAEHDPTFKQASKSVEPVFVIHRPPLGPYLALHRYL
jgi:hypothetical protein